MKFMFYTKPSIYRNNHLETFIIIFFMRKIYTFTYLNIFLSINNETY